MTSPSVAPLNSVPRPRTASQRLAGALANSFLLSHGRNLMRRNEANYFLPLSKWEKLSAGIYLILRDYSTGLFPPTFADQQAAYEAEMNFYSSMTGLDRAEVIKGHIVKPFWDARHFGTYSRSFTKLVQVFESVGLKPGNRLLELGCGSGWVAEFLAIMGYRVVATSIGPDEIEIGHLRVKALKARGIDDDKRLIFRRSPMESVDEVLKDQEPFDCVFVSEALHHAYDWKKTIHTAYRCLKPGGWFILADEPNLIHTFVSYRIGRMTNTHEIGLSRKEMNAEMLKAGFRTTKVFSPRFDNRMSHLWMGGQR